MKNQFTLAAKTADLDLSWSLYKQMGLNKLSLKEKLRLLETINKDNYRFSDLKNSLISDMNSFFLIFLSVVLGWKASPIQALKRSASLSTRKIVSYAMVLYTGLKILEVAINLLPLYFVLSLYCILILFCFI
jgi:hypothetical protein